MWLCFVPAGCLADSLLVIPCSQRVCGCVLSPLNILFNLLCFYHSGYEFPLHNYITSPFKWLFPMSKKVFLVHLSCLPMLTFFLFLLSEGLSSCLTLLEFILIGSHSFF